MDKKELEIELSKIREDKDWMVIPSCLIEKLVEWMVKKYTE